MKTKLVIFGITGDLSRRKLLPALSEIAKTGDFEDLSIVGVSRRDVDVPELLSNQPELIDRTSIFSMDLAEAGDYIRLRDFLGLVSGEQAVVYLSVPPSAAADIVDFLGQAGLNTPNVKILFEKPFGFDLASAKEVIERTSRYFSESQLYRIDHYMAKDVAQEIIRLRRNAENHHHGWGKDSIQSIEVVASEAIGIEGRGVFYEQTGALRDFIQGHLLQLLSLMLMDVPADFPLSELSRYRLGALNHVQPADASKAVRAQYEGYQQEAGNIGSVTETFATLRLESDHQRWLGVPLTLTTGKNLAEKKTFIAVTYKDGSKDIFEEGAQVTNKRLPDAYERVLVESITGRKSIFTTSDEVLRSWEIVAPIQEAWSMGSEPLLLYKPGTRYNANPLHIA